MQENATRMTKGMVRRKNTGEGNGIGNGQSKWKRNGKLKKKGW